MEPPLEPDDRPPPIIAPSPFESTVKIAGRGAHSCRSCFLCLALIALLSGAPTLALGLTNHPWPSIPATLGVALLAVAFLALLAGCAPRPAAGRRRKMSLVSLVEQGRERGQWAG